MVEQRMKDAADQVKSKLVEWVKEVSKEKAAGWDGTALDGMEKALWDAVRRLAAEWQEAMVQAVIEQGERDLGNSVACERCGGKMVFKGSLERGLTTRNGEVRIRRGRYHCGDCKTWAAPVEKRIGLSEGRYSVGVEEMMALAGSACSFAEAAERLKRLTGLEVSATVVRKTTESHGAKVKEAYEQDQLGRPWDYTRGDGRLYGLIDGAMTNTREEGWKELRYLLYRDQHGGQKQARARFGDSEECGRLMRAEAIRLEASRAKEVVFGGDTAVWIWKEVSVNLPSARQVADFYHITTHAHAAAEAVYAKDEGKRKAWVEEFLHVMKHEGGKAGLKWLKRRRTPTAAGRKAVGDLTDYIAKNVDRMDYPRYIADGIPIGSGPVESLCKSVNTQRLKLPGARWNTANAEAVAELRCLWISGMWDAYWQTQRARKAA